MKRMEKKVPAWWVVLGVGFIAGIIYGNIRYHAGKEIGMFFSPSFVAGLAEGVAIDVVYVFRVLRSRALPALCLWILGRGRWQWIFREALMVWVGWFLGMVSVSAVTQQGVFGLLLLLALVFPHFIFYGIAYGWLFRYLKDSICLEENPKTGVLAAFCFGFGCLWEICILPALLGSLCG